MLFYEQALSQGTGHPLRHSLDPSSRPTKEPQPSNPTLETEIHGMPPNCASVTEIHGMPIETPKSASSETVGLESPTTPLSMCETLGPSNSSESSSSTGSNQPFVKHKSLAKWLNWPLWVITALVIFPILGFTIVLVGLTFWYRVQYKDVVPFTTGIPLPKGNAHLFVHFSSTRLVFIASWSSTFAPMLLGCIMLLWHIPTAETLATLTETSGSQQLPTPHQVGLLVGLSIGSFSMLRKYFVYKLKRTRAKEPQLLTRAVAIMIVGLALSFMIFAADTSIHAFTSTVNFCKKTLKPQAEFQYGRGLMPECIDFDRYNNTGLPCSIIPDSPIQANVMPREWSEATALMHNVSLENSIWIVQHEDFPHGDMALLMPQTADTEGSLEYTATTIGVSTQCEVMTTQCNTRLIDFTNETGNENQYVMFNCTENFRGVLGAESSVSNHTGSFPHTDSTTPDFNFKVDMNFQYAYFMDPGLTIPYNSIGAVPNGANISGILHNLLATSDYMLPDDKLINPIYMAAAGFIPFRNNTDGIGLACDPNVLLVDDILVAYTLNCSYASYDVSYVWANRTVRSFTYEQHKNGSIIEMAHGYTALGEIPLSTASKLGSLTNSSVGLAKSFANQNSLDALPYIGSVMSPRMNELEATRLEFLVASVNSTAFAFLVASNLLYVVFGAALAIRAWLTSSAQSRDLVTRLSIEGLAAAAFEEPSEKMARKVKDAHQMFEECRIGHSSRKVGVKRYTGGAHVLEVCLEKS